MTNREKQWARALMQPNHAGIMLSARDACKAARVMGETARKFQALIPRDTAILSIGVQHAIETCPNCHEKAPGGLYISSTGVTHCGCYYEKDRSEVIYTAEDDDPVDDDYGV